MKKAGKVSLLILAGIVMLAGCGKKAVQQTNDNLTDSEATNVTEVVEETKTPEVIEEPEIAEPEEEDGKLEMLQVTVAQISAVYSDDENGNYGCVESIRPKIFLMEDSAKKYPELEKSLETMNKDNMDAVLQQRESLKEIYDDMMADEVYWGPLSDNTKPSILRADSNVLSFHEFYTSYSGGVHGYFAMGGVAFDTKTGKQLELEDVINDAEVFKRVVAEKLVNNYPELFENDPYEYFSDRKLSGDNSFCWDMDYEGINVYFNPYEIASYADGIQSVRITYAESPALFNEKYTEVPEKYILEISDMGEFWADYNNDGAQDYFHLYTDMNEYEDEVLNIELDGKEYRCNTYDYGRKVRYVKTENKSYLYVFHTVENDYQILEIIDLEKMAVVGDEYQFSNYGPNRMYDGDYDQGIYIDGQQEMVDPDNIVLVSRCDSLSTYDGWRSYHIGDDGMPVSDETLYTVGAGTIIRVKQDIKCDIVDDKGNVTQTNTILPADSMVRIIRTNDEDITDVQVGYSYHDWGEYDMENFWSTDEPVDLNKGTIYRLHIDPDDGGSIDGEYVYNLFEGMMYAG